MERRFFVRNISLLGGLSLFSTPLKAIHNLVPVKDKKVSVTILHTNDTHSNIDPFPLNHAKYPGLGGVSKRFKIIQDIRKEEEHVVLLDAGDIFQGTPFFNKYKGLVEMKAMSLMQYDIATLGNHDFDIGLDGFLNAKKEANFTFVNSNYDFKNTVLDTHIQGHQIIEKGGVKIGVFGVGVELEGLVPKENYLETIYLDPIEIANQKANELKGLGCQLIICLSHLGYEYKTDKVSDRVLAAKTQNIHIIIGGHTHTFLNEAVRVPNLIGEEVIINQVGWGGIHLGRIDVEISEKRQFILKKHKIK
jgi:5'-nucleotidase